MRFTQGPMSTLFDSLNLPKETITVTEGFFQTFWCQTETLMKYILITNFGQYERGYFLENWRLH